MEGVSVQFVGRIKTSVLQPSCAGFSARSLGVPSTFVTRPSASKFLSHVRPLSLRQIHKNYVGPRASMQDLGTSERGNEGPSHRGVRCFWDTEEQSGTKQEAASFNWLEQWYPLSVLKHMDKKQPHAETILGRDLVIWWDRNASRWQVFDDVCPHRLAPLSEGRIHESGQLQCSYHGWTFDSCGSCTWIPQLDQGREEAVNNKRACVKVYISMEHQGMIWVWMDRAEGAEQRAAANPPPFVPMLSDPSFVFEIGMSDVNYGYEILLENLLDPSHVPFAHHNIQGNRSAARPLHFRIVDSHIQGFEIRKEDIINLTFHAPTLARMDVAVPPPKAPKGHPLALRFRQWIISRKKSREVEARKQVSSVFYCVPVAPGKSKFIWAYPRNFAQTVFKLTPRWFAHYSHMAIIDSDHLLLHKLEHKIQELGGDTDKLYFTPALADTGVVEFRKWFKRFSRSKVDYGAKSYPTLPSTPPRRIFFDSNPTLPSTTPRRIFFDRHTGHVAKCKICSDAVANFRKLESCFQILPLALVGLLATAALNLWRGLSRFSVPLLCLAVASAVSSKVLSHFVTKMYEYHDYNHALVDEYM